MNIPHMKYIITTTAIIIINIFLWTIFSHTPDKQDMIPETKLAHLNDIEKAKLILINVDMVTTNKIYESGKYSPSAWAFSVLFDNAQKDGIENFLTIFEKAKNNTGQIYALIALYHIDKKTFNKLRSKINPVKNIYFLEYCLMAQISCSEILLKNSQSSKFVHSLVISPIPEFEIIFKQNSALILPHY